MLYISNISKKNEEIRRKTFRQFFGFRKYIIYCIYKKRLNYIVLNHILVYATSGNCIKYN